MTQFESPSLSHGFRYSSSNDDDMGSQATHAAKVQRVAAALAQRPKNSGLSLKKREVSHQVPKHGDLRRNDYKVDISDLDAILSIDAENQTCVAESGVSFARLVRATLRHGLVPLVVPELKTITIGGAVTGCSLESMSFHCGGFHDTCTSYELITADGRVLTCSPSDNALLFQMLHGSFGTLGVLTKLTFRLTPAKPFVRLSYERYDNVADYLRAIQLHAAQRDVDFMDGMIHSPSELILACGHFVDAAPYANRYDWLKIYYLSTKQRQEDYLRTEDYFFRYDHGVTNVHPKSFLGRLLFGKFLDSGRLLRLADRFHRLLPKQDPDVTLDVFIPLSRVAEFLSWYAKEFGHFPLWCVPFKRVRDYEWIQPSFFQGLKDDLFVDLAIYGMKQRDGKNYHRIMERKLAEIGGIKTLISHNFYTREEFWSIWNRTNYEEVKALVDPENVFRDLYEKTCLTAMGRKES